MMLTKVKFYPGGHTYFGKNLANDGYTGEADVLVSAVALVIIKPGAKLGAVKRGLEIILADLDLRIDLENEGKR